MPVAASTPPPPQTLEAGSPNSTWHLVRWAWQQAPLGPVVVLLAHVVLLAAALALFFPQSGAQDLYWYLATGKLQAHPRLHALPEPKPAEGPWIPGPTIDPFGWTTSKERQAPGFEPWINHEWLFTLGIYRTYAAGGMEALVTLKYLLLGLWGLALIWLAMRLANDVYLGILTAITVIPGLGGHCDLRPQLITYTLVTLLLATWYRAPQRPWLALIIWALLLILWANLHAAVVFGVGLLVVLLLVHRWQGSLPWSVVAPGLVLVLLAPLLNPYGTEVYAYALGWLSNRDLSFAIQEWRSILDHGLAGPSEWFWLVTGVVALGAAFLTSSAGRLRLEPQALLMWAIWLMPLQAVRHQPLAVIALTAWWFQEVARTLPWLVMKLRPATEVQPAVESVRIGPRLWAEAAAVIATLIIIPSARLLRPLQAYPRTTIAHLHHPYAFPRGAVAFMKENHLEGKIFNSYDWGGYLDWRAIEDIDDPGSDRPPGWTAPNLAYTCIDGRLDTVYPLDVIQAYGNIISMQPTPLTERSGWALVGDEVDFVLLPLELSAVAPDVLVQWSKLDGWVTLYVDNLAMLLGRRSRLSPEMAAAAPLYLPVPNDPQAHLGRGTFAMRTGDVEGAIREFEAALILDPSCAAAHHQLGLVLKVTGDKERSDQHLRDAEYWGHY